MRILKTSDIESRIERVTESGCWIWTRSIMANGYGCIRLAKKTHSAHRISYQTYKGQIGDGLHVLHTCDVRSCVNPAHLYLGTNRDNIDDSVKKGRRVGITRNRPSGLKYKPMSEAGRAAHMKIKPNARVLIQAEFRAGVTQAQLAKKHGVSPSAISRVCHES